jgi:hypothetical protein
MNLLGVGIGAIGAASGDRGGGFATIMSGVVGMVGSVVWMLLGALIIFGGVKMKSLKSYGLSMAAAVLAALPCTSYWCCLIGLPVGIWAIVVLMDQQVKASFTA